MARKSPFGPRTEKETIRDIKKRLGIPIPKAGPVTRKPRPTPGTFVSKK
ncbi:hypothetical protein LCGC14_0291790, partial [marine sediment metagenome]